MTPKDSKQMEKVSKYEYNISVECIYVQCTHVYECHGRLIHSHMFTLSGFFPLLFCFVLSCLFPSYHMHCPLKCLHSIADFDCTVLSNVIQNVFNGIYV